MTHYHNKGTMRIQGSITNPNGTMGILNSSFAGADNYTGALNGSDFSGAIRTGSSNSTNPKTVTFDTNNHNGNGWTGLTSSTVNSSGTAITNTQNASQDHTHSMYLFGDNETRPDNFTIKIWKRTA